MAPVGDAVTEFLKAIPNPFGRNNPDLIVLRITLALGNEKPEVVFDLTGYGKIGEHDRRTWRLALAEIGISEQLSPGPMQETSLLSLPLQLQEGLKAGLALMKPAADIPLWLDLVRPYGFLGMLQWERALCELLHRPVLRLPDFLVRPRENTDVLESAIVFDPPPSSSPEIVTAQLKMIVGELLAGSPRAQTRIRIFPCAAWQNTLANFFTDKRVTVYDADKNREALGNTVSDKPREFAAASPWFDWICAELKGRSLDAVHFVCRARATESTAVLLLGSSPFSPQTVAAIEIADIGGALIRLGAWAAIFSPPAGEPESATMAFVADTFAQSKPGSVLFHPAAPDSSEDLRDSFRFLFSGVPAHPPKLIKGFLYCQPESVAAHAGFNAKAASSVLPSELPALAKQASWMDRVRAKAGVYIPAVGVDLKPPPDWASAAQRYVESAALNQLRRVSTDVLFTKSAAALDQVKSAAQSETVQKTLSDIQKIVGSYMNKPDR